MARYLTVTPKYNPISIDEYLKVPMLLAKEYKEEEEKVESYKDKMSYIRNLMGDKGSKYLQQYDDLMNSISDDPSVANMTRVGKQLREIYRDVSSKADIAKTNRDRYQAMFDKDPSLIGDVGSFDKYYEDPNYKPSMISGSQLQKDIGIWAAQQKQAQVPIVKGVMPGDKSKLILEQGYTPDQLNGFIADATSGAPQTQQGKELAAILEQHGYNNASESDKAKLSQYITGGLANASAAISTTTNPNYVKPTTHSESTSSEGGKWYNVAIDGQVMQRKDFSGYHLVRTWNEELKAWNDPQKVYDTKEGDDQEGEEEVLTLTTVGGKKIEKVKPEYHDEWEEADNWPNNINPKSGETVYWNKEDHTKYAIGKKTKQKRKKSSTSEEGR